MIKFTASLLIITFSLGLASIEYGTDKTRRLMMGSMLASAAAFLLSLTWCLP